MNPVTVEMLTADWESDPGMTGIDRERLLALPVDVVQRALDNAFTANWQDMWWQVLDGTRGDATRVLKHLMSNVSAWPENEDHPVADWQSEVANRDTSLGYYDWVQQQKELS